MMILVGPSDDFFYLYLHLPWVLECNLYSFGINGKDNMCPAVEDSGVRLRQAVHDAPFHRISLILSPDVSFHCVGINRIAKHRRFQLQDNGNQCRAQSELMRKMKT